MEMRSKCATVFVLIYVYFISRFCLYMYVQFYVYSKYTVAENNYFLHLITLYRIHGKDDETLHLYSCILIFMKTYLPRNS